MSPVPDQPKNSDRRHTLGLVLLTLVVSIGWFVLDGHLKVNFGDEGWLWYGSEALRRGEVPMRDFASYDPGRYVWVVGWSFLFGHSLFALRLACVMFQCLGVYAGLLAARRLSRNWLFLIGMALLFAAWMHPRYKSFEQTIALMAVYAGVLLLERPSVRRHWWVGVFGGLCAFMGRNHGAYHVLAFGLLITWSAWGENWKLWLRRGFAWGAGLLVGYLPQLLMFLFVPGFFAAFRSYILSMVASGATNLPAPVPWPWVVRSDLPLWARVSTIVEAWWYVALPLFFLLVLVRAWKRGRVQLTRYPVLIAAACVSVPYTHFVFSRPDIVHLTHGAPTVALGAIALAFTFADRWKRLGYVLVPPLLAASLLANLFEMGISLTLSAAPDSLFDVDVRGVQMTVPRAHAQVLESARHVALDLAKPDEPILFMPVVPTLYPFTGRRSPIYEIYFVAPLDDAKLLAQIKTAGVQWVMLQDYALENREEMRFRNTNPLVMQYFASDFVRVPVPTLPEGFVVLRRREETPPAAP